MDQQKIGKFLKELRNEKEITQEQLAETLNVSGRTVSRWETGKNMPDISILVDLSEFYDVSIMEIIDGERKSEIMNEEVKEAVLGVSEYAQQEKRNLLKTVRILGVLGILLQMIGFLIQYYVPAYEDIGDFLLGMGFAFLVFTVLFVTGQLDKLKRRGEK